MQLISSHLLFFKNSCQTQLCTKLGCETAALATCRRPLTILSCRHMHICCRSNETAVSSFCIWRWPHSSISIAIVNNSLRALCTVRSLITFMKKSYFDIKTQYIVFQYVLAAANAINSLLKLNWTQQDMWHQGQTWYGAFPVVCKYRVAQSENTSLYDWLTVDLTLLNYTYLYCWGCFL